MSEEMRLWVETSFNIVYLIAVWWIVLVMWQRRSLIAESDRRTAWLMMLAFFFLGLGGHRTRGIQACCVRPWWA